MIRQCRSDEFGVIGEIINDAAQAYRGVIPEDRWHEPYMSLAELEEQMKDGVIFWGTEQDGKLAGVMGIQPVQDVTLIRHAYVRTACRNQGIGGRLVAASARIDDPADFDWNLGGGGLGRCLLRETRFSEGNPGGKGPAAQKILVHSRTPD